MSVVNMVPRQRNCESSDDMMAARIPAVRNPVRAGLAMRSLMIFDSTAPGFMPNGRSPDAQIPISTQGAQTIMMHNGCATSVSLNALALRAVSQC